MMLELTEGARGVVLDLPPFTVLVDDGDGSARTILRMVLDGAVVLTDDKTGVVERSEARLVDEEGVPLHRGRMVDCDPSGDTARVCMTPTSNVKSLADDYLPNRDAFRVLLGEGDVEAAHAGLLRVPGYLDAAFALVPTRTSADVEVYPDLGAGLHPRMASRLAAELRRRAAEGGTRYLAATVNVGVLDPCEPAEVLCCAFDAEGGLHIARMDDFPAPHMVGYPPPSQFWLSPGCGWVVRR